MEKRAAHVQAFPVAPGEDAGRDEIDRDTDESDGEDDAAAHVRRIGAPPRRAVHDPDADEQQRETVRLRRENLRPPEAERPRPPGRARRQACRDERAAERGRVGEHVPRVGEQRERAGEETRDDLAGHEGEDQYERDAEQPPVVNPRVVVAVSVQLVHPAASSAASRRRLAVRGRVLGEPR